MLKVKQIKVLVEAYAHSTHSIKKAENKSKVKTKRIFCQSSASIPKSLRNTWVARKACLQAKKIVIAIFPFFIFYNGK
jgi:hypothetical protein